MKKFDKVNPVVVAKNENNKLDLLSKVRIKNKNNNIMIQNNPTIHYY